MAVYLLFDVGGTSIKAAAANERGVFLDGCGFVWPTHTNGTREQILADFYGALDKLWRQAQPYGAAAGAGYAITGPFDYARGISLIRGVGKYEAIYGLPLRDTVKGWARQMPYAKAEGFAVAMQNDAAMFALGEYFWGQAAGFSRAMFVTLGTGAGSSFVADGRLVVDGPRVPADGFIYNTPFAASVIDDYISRRGILRLAADAGLPPQADVRELAQLAQAGDARAQGVFEQFGTNMGLAIAGWVKAFAPGILVVGGQIARAHLLFGSALQRQLPEVRIAFSQDTSRSAFLGILQHLLAKGG